MWEGLQRLGSFLHIGMSAKEGIKGTSMALQNPLPGGVRGTELGPGTFGSCGITLTNPAQVVSSDLFRKHCRVNVWDLSEAPGVLYSWS